MQISDLILPATIFAVLVAGAVAFVQYFVRPSLKLGSVLRTTIENVRAATSAKTWDLTECFAGDEALAHAWAEYSASLHKLRTIDPDNQSTIISRVLATQPAEAFFSGQSIVDHRVNAEFFKHLPGIFTGIGIIGTFTGLIAGLQHFEISPDPEKVRQSLNGLLAGVSHAFVVSAGAIVFAMAATFFEKLQVNRLYGWVEQLNRLIDSSFETGAGEEYLSRLVVAAEDSSTQTRILKDALVTDLRQILTDLTERQIVASQQSAVELGREVSQAVSGVLKEPLDQIAAAVGQVSQDQSGAVTKLLTDVLAGFSEKLERMFGGQLSGIGEMQQRTLAALETAVTRLQEMTANVEAAGSRTAEAMADKLAAAMAASEARQKAINEELVGFMAQWRSTAGEAQSETRASLQLMLAELGQQLGSAVKTAHFTDRGRAFRAMVGADFT